MVARHEPNRLRRVEARADVVVAAMAKKDDAVDAAVTRHLSIIRSPDGDVDLRLGHGYQQRKASQSGCSAVWRLGSAESVSISAPMRQKPPPRSAA
jgi:hypothetical protein